MIPALSAGAFFVVLPFRRYLPLRGAFVSIAAIALGFGLFWFALAGLLSDGRDLLRGGLAANWRDYYRLGRRG